MASSTYLTNSMGHRVSSLAAALEVAHRVPISCHVYTPEAVADAIVDALGDTPSARWLEPCVGGGVFLKALNKLEIPPSRIDGLDLVCKPAQCDAFAHVIRGREFLEWSRLAVQRYDRIVANPPYARLTKCSKTIRREAKRLSKIAYWSVPGNANLWYGFLISSFRLLAPGGSFAFVLPASFEYANYSLRLRHCLPQLFKEVVVMRAKKSLFREPPVEGGAIVLLARGKRALASDETSAYRRVLVSGVNSLVNALRSLRPHSRTTQVVTRPPLRIIHGSVPLSSESALSSIVSIRIGAVTGDTNFFMMNEKKRSSLRIPQTACALVISRTRHLAHGTVGKREMNRLMRTGERVWLLSPSRSNLQSRGVRDYLALRAAEGGCNRKALKVRTRDPWFKVMLPQRPHAFVSPALGDVLHVALANTKVTATNSLYVLRFKMALTRSQRAAVLLSLYLPQAMRTVAEHTRLYVGGLRKMEPNDLGKVPVRIIQGQCPGAVKTLQKAMRAIGEGNTHAGLSIARAWLRANGVGATPGPAK